MGPRVKTRAIRPFSRIAEATAGHGEDRLDRVRLRRPRHHRPPYRRDRHVELAALAADGVDALGHRPGRGDAHHPSPVPLGLDDGALLKHLLDVVEVVEHQTEGDPGALGDEPGGGARVPLLDEVDHGQGDVPAGPLAAEQATVVVGVVLVGLQRRVETGAEGGLVEHRLLRHRRTHHLMVPTSSSDDTGNVGPARRPTFRHGWPAVDAVMAVTASARRAGGRRRRGAPRGRAGGRRCWGWW